MTGLLHFAMTATRTLGTNLRRLVELLDGDVDAAYADAGLGFRATFTPVVRALLAGGTLSVRELAIAAGTSHSAASQTVAQMKRAGLLDAAGSSDGRERRVQLSADARRILPAVQALWRRADEAAAELDAELDAELGLCLNDVISQALEALEHRAFRTRFPDIQNDA
jgi:DNA-binding MarR family transcriptional regulator